MSSRFLNSICIINNDRYLVETLNQVQGDGLCKRYIPFLNRHAELDSASLFYTYDWNLTVFIKEYLINSYKKVTQKF